MDEVFMYSWFKKGMILRWPTAVIRKSLSTFSLTNFPIICRLIITSLCSRLGGADVPNVSLRLLTSVLLDKLVLVLVEVALPLREVFVDQSVRAVLVTHVQLGFLGHLGEWARVDPIVLVRLLLLLEEGKGLGRPVGVPLLGGVALPSLLDPTPLP